MGISTSLTAAGWNIVGLPLTDLLGWRWTSMIHPEDVEELFPSGARRLNPERPLSAESRVRRADGEYRWFLHRKEPLRNEAGEIVKWYGSSIEIQERKTAEEKIREQETELRQILDLAPQHIGVFAPDGSRLYVNHTALEYFGVTLEQWRAEALGLKPAFHGSDLDMNSFIQKIENTFLTERNKRFLEGRAP